MTCKLFNLETDYAIRIVDCLALNDGIVGANEISRLTGVSRRFALKILGNLVSNGFLISQKGANGGYKLAKLPEEISLLDIIESVNGKITFSRCQADEGGCSHPHSSCKFQSVFNDATVSVRDLFANAHFERK